MIMSNKLFTKLLTNLRAVGQLKQFSNHATQKGVCMDIR